LDCVLTHSTQIAAPAISIPRERAKLAVGWENHIHGFVKNVVLVEIIPLNPRIQLRTDHLRNPSLFHIWTIGALALLVMFSKCAIK
jgi:hypothetical protein